MQRTTLTYLTLLLLASAGMADEADVAAQLEAKGVKFKKEKTGTVTEISFGPKATLALDDYRQIGQFPNLRRAWMAADKLPLNDETLQAVGTLAHVEHFFANGAKLTDDGFKGFAGWKKLKHFGLDHWGWFETKDKKLVGKGLAHLAVLPELESIRLGGCRIDNQATEALAKIPTLQVLDLSHDGVTDDGIPSLQKLTKLRVIKLSPQYTPRTTDASLEHLSKIATLEEIEIAETLLTYDKGFVHLKGLKNLKTLHLRNVVASEKDVERLRADLPAVKVDWTQPDEATAAKTRQAFDRHRAKQGK